MHYFRNIAIIKFFLRYKYYLSALLAIILLIILAVLFEPVNTPEKPVTPPVVSKTEALAIVSVSPVGDFNSLDVFHPIAVEFNMAIGSDVSGIFTTATPAVDIEKYTLSAKPNTLWLKPVQIPDKEVQGWLEGVEYTITISQGSKSSDGAVLSSPYVFRFRNSSSDVYMISD